VIEKEKIEQLVSEKLVSTDKYIVEITVSTDNNISVIIDSDTFIGIDDCITISRYVESCLDEEGLDFSLDVASFGLGYPLKLVRQFNKNIGKEVELILNNGLKIKGILEAADDDSISVKTTEKIKVEGKKKKQLVEDKKVYLHKDIKSTKVVVSFK
jgi:ribosome maturation factor RimP